MNLFIDGEWNSYKGALISFAIVGSDGREFYEELVMEDEVHPWVQQNVMPHLGQEKVTYEVFQSRLRQFLDGIPEDVVPCVISDWPEDVEQFCRALVVGPGEVSVYRPIGFMCAMGKFKHAKSAVPHHALWDARGNREAWNTPA